MDVPERTDSVQEPISMVRGRELLGDEADELSDDDVRNVARHAEGLARILIALARQGAQAVHLCAGPAGTQEVGGDPFQPMDVTARGLVLVTFRTRRPATTTEKIPTPGSAD